MSRPALAVVQCRMGSTRFPGKVLRLLAGRPLLWHVVERLRRAETIAEVVLATSNGPSDDAVAATARELGVRCVRGPEDDVLARFELATRDSRQPIVVRITGDCPLIDPKFVDRMVRVLLRDGGDYARVANPRECLHEGCDPLTLETLRRLSQAVPGHPVAREHVTGYFSVDPEFARAVVVPLQPWEQVPGVRLSVDTPADLSFLEALYQRSGSPPGQLSLEAAAELLSADPSLQRINAGVRQRRPTDRPRLVAFCVESGGSTGLGHLTRCLSIAHAFRHRLAWGVVFLHGGDDAGLLAEGGFERLPVGPAPEETAAALERRRPDAVVCDLRAEASREDVARWRAATSCLAVIDDTSERRLAATAAFYPPLPQLTDLSWEGSDARRYVGWEWCATSLRPGDAHDSAPGPPNLLLTFGGSDVADLSRRVPRALAAIGCPLEVTLVVGPCVSNPQAVIADATAALPSLRTVVAPRGLGPLLAAAELVVCTYGVTVFETVAIGRGCAFFNYGPDDARSGTAFTQAGIAHCLGRTDARDETLADKLRELLFDLPLRESLSAAAQAAPLDLEGPFRIASQVAALVEG